MRLRQDEVSPGVGVAKVKASTVPPPDTHGKERSWRGRHRERPQYLRTVIKRRGRWLQVRSSSTSRG